MKPGSVDAIHLRNEIVLRHLHDSGYDFEAALAGIAALLKHEQMALVAGSGPDSPCGWVTRRLDAAMKKYGKNFEKAKHAMNRTFTYDAVTVGQLAVHYYAKWKHSKEYNRWINTTEYKQQKRGVAIEAQSSTGSPGMIADGQSRSQQKAQRRQRRQESRKKKVCEIDS